MEERNRKYNHELGDIPTACGVDKDQLDKFGKKIADIILRGKILDGISSTISRDIQIIEEFITQHPILIRMYVIMSVPFVASVIAKYNSTEDMMKAKASTLGISIHELEERLVFEMPEDMKDKATEIINKIRNIVEESNKE